MIVDGGSASESGGTTLIAHRRLIIEFRMSQMYLAGLPPEDGYHPISILSDIIATLWVLFQLGESHADETRCGRW